MKNPQQDWEDDWKQELQSHLDLRADYDSTTEEAYRRFGNRLQISEEVRSVRIPVVFDQSQQDIRYALRSFLRSPVFTLTALIAIAIGIGASAAVFSVVDRILFRHLPYQHEERLVWLGMAAPIDPNEFLLSPDYFEWRKNQTAFESFTASRGATDCDLTANDPVRLRCGQVAFNFLETLGVKPIIGRDLAAADDEQGAAPVGLLTFALWQTRFAANPNVLDRTIELNRQPVRIVGVLPKDFEFPTLQHIDILRPMQLRQSQQQAGTMFFLTAFARLHSGQTIPQATAQIQPLYKQSLEHVPARFRKEVTFRIHSMHDRQTRDSRLAAIFLLAAVLIVLLIACANVANLLLARAASREREFSIRASIGASRGRLLRQSVAESLLLSTLGTGLGLAVAAALLKVFVAIAPDGLPRLEEAPLDWRVLLAAVFITISCTLFFGVLPLAPKKSTWFRPALITAQIALSTVLLSGAGIFLHSLSRMAQTPLGMRTSQIMTIPINLHRERYPNRQQQLQFFDSLEERVRQIPGVESVAISDTLPPLDRNATAILSQIQVEGRAVETTAPTGGMVIHRQVSPAYFEMLHVPLLAGRTFTEEDRPAGDNPVVISQALARRLFPNGNAVGQRFRVFEGPFRPIVGVVADVKNAGIVGKDDPEFYEIRRHHESSGRAFSHLMIKTTADPSSLASVVKREIRALDPHLPVELTSLESRVTALTARSRFQSTLLSGFATIGLVLAAIGLYGVMTFLVTRRRSEIGLRLALGATPADIQKLILGQAMTWTALGLAIGLAATYPAFRYAKSLLFTIEPNDPLAMALAVVVLGFTALLAAWFPSSRAASIEPLQALRHN